MQQRQLGSSPVKVSEIGLGTWGMSGAFWGAADDEESIRVIRRALDLGITLIDTAEAYGHGHAEEVVGQALAGARQGGSKRSASRISALPTWTAPANTASSTCCSRPTTCCGARLNPRRCPIAASTISASCHTAVSPKDCSPARCRRTPSSSRAMSGARRCCSSRAPMSGL
ncbi:MAG: aldo/keto reductase [Mesorhizobium sp.]|nr:MAG: aldo/keto reductase [Mesorhizobium sp.]